MKRWGVLIAASLVSGLLVGALSWRLSPSVHRSSGARAVCEHSASMRQLVQTPTQRRRSDAQQLVEALGFGGYVLKRDGMTIKSLPKGTLSGRIHRCQIGNASLELIERQDATKWLHHAGLGAATSLLLLLMVASVRRRESRSRRHTAPTAIIHSMATAMQTLGESIGLPQDAAETAAEVRDQLMRLAKQVQQQKSRAEEATTRAVRAEKIAAWRGMSRVLAHEIKNPLAPIRLSIETLQRAKKKQHPDFDALFDASSATIVEEVSRLKVLVDSFADFAKFPRPMPSPFDARELVSHLAALHPAQPLQTLVPDVPVMLTADRNQLTQALVNLVTNAFESCDTPNVTLELVENDSHVEFNIRDNGPGVSDPTSVFEPFVSSKERGSGLGLAIVARIAADHGGHVDVIPSQTGAHFRLQVARNTESVPDVAHVNPNQN